MSNTINIWYKASIIGLVLFQMTSVVSATFPEKLSIDRAIEMAQLHDPWLDASKFNQSKLAASAVAAGQLNDPTVSLGVANMGADRFAFNQEPMTQLKVGITQMFPRGQTRNIKTAQLNLMAQEQPMLRANRLALLKKQTSLYWLDAYQAQQSIALITQDRPLFEQLIDLIEASYASGFGASRQQDLIRAELELTRLDDRLSVLSHAYEKHLQQLNGLISEPLISVANASASPTNHVDTTDKASFHLVNELPDIKRHDVLKISQQELKDALLQHPAVKAMDVQIQVENKAVELAHQKYKPAWGLNAQYGYRGDADNGINRADLFSIGVTFELPIFTKNRQDQGLKAALYSVDAKESQKTLMIRELMASFDTAKAEWFRLNERNALYQKSLLPQMSEQAEAALNAYTHDDGDFAEVIRARIAELNAQIDALNIQVEMAKVQVEINYLLTGRNQSHAPQQAAQENSHES